MSDKKLTHAQACEVGGKEMNHLDEKAKKAHEALRHALAIRGYFLLSPDDPYTLKDSQIAKQAAHAAIDELANAVRSQHEDSGKSAVTGLPLNSETEKILQRWIDDLQSGLYINCVYCGHRYGPGEGKPTLRAALEEHVSRCPHHPLGSALKQIAELKERLASAGVDTEKVREAIWSMHKARAQSYIAAIPYIDKAISLLEEALQPLCYIDHGDKPPMSIPHRHGGPEKVKR